MELGALRYLLKPISRDALLDAVANATKLHRLARLKRDAAAQR